MIDMFDFNKQLDQIEDLWTPLIVAQTDDHIFKLVKVQGDFSWHVHDSDKILMVLEGTMSIEFKQKDTITLNKGEMYFVPGQTEHKPYSEDICGILLIEVKDK